MREIYQGLLNTLVPAPARGPGAAVCREVMKCTGELAPAVCLSRTPRPRWRLPARPPSGLPHGELLVPGPFFSMLGAPSRLSWSPSLEGMDVPPLPAT